MKSVLLFLLAALLAKAQHPVEILVPLDNACQHSHTLAYELNVTLPAEFIMSAMSSPSDYFFRVDLGWDTDDILEYVEAGASFYKSEFGIEFPPVSEAWDNLKMVSYDGAFQLMGKHHSPSSHSAFSFSTSAAPMLKAVVNTFNAGCHDVYDGGLTLMVLKNSRYGGLFGSRASSTGYAPATAGNQSTPDHSNLRLTHFSLLANSWQVKCSPMESTTFPPAVLAAFPLRSTTNLGPPWNLSASRACLFPARSATQPTELARQLACGPSIC